MLAYRKPWFSFDYRVKAEVDALREYRDQKFGRQIPTKSTDRLLVATWTIPNLGVHSRRSEDYLILAEMINWFDVVALQEVNDNLDGLLSIQNHLPNSYLALYSKTGGKKERLAFLYDSKKLRLLGEGAELTIPETDQPYIKLPGIKHEFRAFDRNPYLAVFASSLCQFLLVNVHLYSGGDRIRSLGERILETYAILRWADLTKKKDDRASHIIALGQFNLPKVSPADKISKTLRRIYTPAYSKHIDSSISTDEVSSADEISKTLGRIYLPEHSTRISSSISTNPVYDHIMFLVRGTPNDLLSQGPNIFDFDGVLFRKLWETGSHRHWKSYIGYYISDHRILWAEFLTRPAGS
jgi:endonuclease/exonuclease/phosphatase family metal-dependent hydrolase